MSSTDDLPRALPAMWRALKRGYEAAPLLLSVAFGLALLAALPDALLVAIHPALALLAAFALPTVLTSTWRPGVERATEERGTSANRLARHLFDVATTAPAGKEVRVTRIGARLVAERRAAWERWYGPVARARGRSAVWHALAWALFGAAYVGAVVFVASLTPRRRLYDPTGGRTRGGDGGLARMRGGAWRPPLWGAFQAFSRCEFRLRERGGVGDRPRLDDGSAVTAAIDRAGASDVVQQLGAGLETQLGPTWPEGVELSFGQWQKLALARGFMRDGPPVLVLDEPTPALDPETEHALFERYAAAARGSDDRITILVSHRFSTVRMADFIVVLHGSRLVESGTHEALMARGGRYADLYRIQAAAYR